MLKSNPDLLQTETPFGSWLHVSAKAGELKLTKELVALGVDINRTGGTFKGTAINLAASAGQHEVVNYLLGQGAELDTSEPERNPLWAAIYGGHISIAKLLVEHGIDFQVRYSGDSMKNTGPIEFAVERGQYAIAEYLQNSQGSGRAPAV